MAYGTLNRPECADIDIAALERQAEESRAAQQRALDSLIEKLHEAIATEMDFDFGGLLAVAQQMLHLDDLKMSRLLKVARPTIGRWIRGTSKPHRLARRAVLDALVKKARAEIKSLRA